MKKVLIAVAAAGLAAAAVAPASANSAPWWANTASIGGTLYGNEGSYDPMVGWTPGSIDSGDVYLDVSQYGSMTIRLVSIDLGNNVSLSGAPSVNVYGRSGDSCNTDYQSTSVSGDEITVKGIACSDTDSDGYTEFEVDAYSITGSINSYYFDDQKIEAQYRGADNRGRTGSKYPSYRVSNSTGLDYWSND